MNKLVEKIKDEGTCDTCYWANQIGECQIHEGRIADVCVDYEKDLGWN